MFWFFESMETLGMITICALVWAAEVETGEDKIMLRCMKKTWMSYWNGVAKKYYIEYPKY